MKRLALAAWGTAVAALQLTKLWLYFPDLSVIFDSEARLTHVDFPTLEYQVESARHFFAATGRLWGYDPFHLAGFPLSFLWNSNVFLQILGVILGGVAASQLLKLVLVAIIVVEPMLVYAALSRFGGTRPARCAATILVLLYLGLCHPVMLLVIGMLTGYAVFLVFPYAWGRAQQLVEHGGAPKAWMQLGATLALGLLVHKTFLVLMAPCSVVMAGHLARAKAWPRLGALAGAWAGALLLNAFWILPSMRLSQYVDFSFNPFFRDPKAIPVIEWTLLLEPSARALLGRVPTDGEHLYGLLNGAYLVCGALFTLACVGAAAWWRAGRRLEVMAAGATIATLVAVVVLGNSIPGLEGLHGVRFYFALGVVFGPPAVAGIDAQWERAGAKRRAVLVAAGSAAVVLALLLPSYQSAIASDVAAERPTLLQRSPLFTFGRDRLSVEADALRRWLKENVPASEVVFLSTHPGNHYMSGLYVGSGVRFISAPYNYIFYRHNYVNRYFQDVVRGPPHPWPGAPVLLAGRPQLGDMARLFNVRWWVIDRAGAGLDFAQVAGMGLVHTIGDYDIYRYAPPDGAPMSDFFLGSGVLKLGYGRSIIRDVKAVDKKLMVKLHWLEGMEVEGAAGVEPLVIEGLPMPFITILDPGPTVELRY